MSSAEFKVLFSGHHTPGSNTSLICPWWVCREEHMSHEQLTDVSSPFSSITDSPEAHSYRLRRNMLKQRLSFLSFFIRNLPELIFFWPYMWGCGNRQSLWAWIYKQAPLLFGTHCFRRYENWSEVYKKRIEDDTKVPEVQKWRRFLLKAQTKNSLSVKCISSVWTAKRKVI